MNLTFLEAKQRILWPLKVWQEHWAMQAQQKFLRLPRRPPHKMVRTKLRDRRWARTFLLQALAEVTLRPNLGTPMPPTTAAGMLRAAAVRQLMRLDGSMPDNLTPLGRQLLEP